MNRDTVCVCWGYKKSLLISSAIADHQRGKNKRERGKNDEVCNLRQVSLGVSVLNKM